VVSGADFLLFGFERASATFLAQLGEHLPCKQGVRSSNLLVSTNKAGFKPQLFFENCMIQKQQGKKK
jgi:hypothetical protein